MALKRNPEAVAAFQELIVKSPAMACAGFSYQNMDEATEREHMRVAVQIIRELTGSAPQG